MMTKLYRFYLTTFHLSNQPLIFFCVFLLQISFLYLFFFIHLQILAGLLQLGNLNFSSSADDSQPCNLGEESEGTAFSNTLNPLEY